MAKLQIFFIILLFSGSEVFAQNALYSNPNSSDNSNLPNNSDYSANQSYLPYQVDLNSSNIPDYAPTQLNSSDNIFNNPNYIPDQDPALLSDSRMDKAPKQMNKDQALDINKTHNDSKLIKSDNSRSTIFAPQKQTPSRIFSADLSKPEIFINSNNLIKKTGSFYHARGEIISIEGKITDSFGVPIQGAIIEIWQTNAAGKYQNLLEKNSRFLDVYFNMSGRAITDNLGNYSFLTIMPGSYQDRAPHINMNIYHEQFGKIETEVYFDKHPKNDLDYEYLSYSEEDRKLLTAKVELSNKFDKTSYKRCYFNIVMSGVHKYKSFSSTL